MKALGFEVVVIQYHHGLLGPQKLGGILETVREGNMGTVQQHGVDVVVGRGLGRGWWKSSVVHWTTPVLPFTKCPATRLALWGLS